MRSLILLLCLLTLLAGGGFSQTRVDLNSQSKSVDFSGATYTLPVRTGTSLPATCRTGELYYKTSAPAGQNLYGCTSTNTWTLQSGGGSGGGGGAVSSVAGKIGDVILQSSDLADLKVKLSSGAITVGNGCSSASPCVARFGSKVYIYTNQSSVSAIAGVGGAGPYTIFFYISPDGTRWLGVDGGNVTSATLSNIVQASGITNFPSTSYPLASCQVSGNTITQCTDVRASGRDVIGNADGTIQLVGNPTTGGQDIAVNQAAFVTPSGNNDLSGSNKVNLGGQHLSITVQNDATTGTVQNRFAMLGGNGRATVATTTASGRILGVCVAGCGNTGVARIATRGQVTAEFDGPTVAANYVTRSAITAGVATDAGTSRPTSGQVLGYVMNTNVALGTYSMMLEPDMVAAAGGGGGGTTQTDYLDFGLPMDRGSNGYPSVSYTDLLQFFARGDRFGTLGHPDGSRTGVRFSVELPATWTGAVDLQIVLYNNAISGTTKWDVFSACWPAGGAASAWSAAQSHTIALSGSFTKSTLNFPAVSTAGCAPGSTLLFKVERDGADASDIYTDYAEVFKYVVIRRRSN